MKSRAVFAVLAFTLASPGFVAAQSRTVGGSDPAVGHVQDQVAEQQGARKAELVASILSARETASGRTFSSGLRASLTGKLFVAPLASLEAFSSAGGLGNIDGLVPNVFGDSAADLVFTPVTPCRIVNTVATGTPLAANTSRAFYVNGSAAAVFEAQGGKAGGCGIPDSATAVEMNFIAVGPAGPGDFRAFPWAAAPVEPVASVINYSNLAGLNIANGLAQPVCNAATTTCTFDLIVKADVAQSHLIIDVVGYYNKTGQPVLRSGQTVFGSIGARQNVPSAGELAATASLPMPAPVGLDDAHVQIAGFDALAGQCTGTALNPTAAPGFVCMYTFFTQNATENAGYIWGGGDGTKVGFQISWDAVAAGPSVYFANWAYTAP